MPRRSSKDRPPADPNEAAARLVKLATGEQVRPLAVPEKNAAAVALGRLGGAKGGKARAEKLSPIRRSEIALRAAEARWQKSK